MPKVSVIIPSYNRADMVGDAVQSVLDQTYADWELIVVDDGSTDDTQLVVGSIPDPRIQYLYQENKGLPGARNTGIRAARGQYVAFLDSDDLYLPHKLERQVEVLERRPALGLIAGGYTEVDKRLHVLREVQPWHGCPTLEFQDWLLACPFCPSAPLVRREWLERVGLFDETMQRIEDWDLWLRMSHVGCRMDWLKESVCYYRIHGGNMVRNVLLMRQGMIITLDKLYAQPNLPPEILALHDAAYAHVLLNAAARAYAANASQEGKESLGKALELDPSLLAGEPPQALSSLASFALSPLAEDPEVFMDVVLSNLPEKLDSIQWSKSKTRGLLHAVSAFDCRQLGKSMAVVRHGLSAIVCDLRWARNLGLLSITGRAMWKQAKSLIKIRR